MPSFYIFLSLFPLKEEEQSYGGKLTLLTKKREKTTFFKVHQPGKS